LEVWCPQKVEKAVRFEVGVEGERTGRAVPVPMPQGTGVTEGSRGGSLIWAKEGLGTIKLEGGGGGLITGKGGEEEDSGNGTWKNRGIAQ